MLDIKKGMNKLLHFENAFRKFLFYFMYFYNVTDSPPSEN